MDKPVIYGFCNNIDVDKAERDQWLTMIAMAEDGTVLAGHICSNYSFANHDLQTDNKLDRYAEHYPDGYEFVLLPRGERPPDEVMALNSAKGERETE